MLPPVAEVVLVEEPFIAAEPEVSEPNHPCIVGKPESTFPAALKIAAMPCNHA
jgi:hypothetical protein